MKLFDIFTEKNLFIIVLSTLVFLVFFKPIVSFSADHNQLSKLPEKILSYKVGDGELRINDLSIEVPDKFNKKQNNQVIAKNIILNSSIENKNNSYQIRFSIHIDRIEVVKGFMDKFGPIDIAFSLSDLNQQQYQHTLRKISQYKTFDHLANYRFGGMLFPSLIFSDLKQLIANGGKLNIEKFSVKNSFVTADLTASLNYQHNSQYQVNQGHTNINIIHYETMDKCLAINNGVYVTDSKINDNKAQVATTIKLNHLRAYCYNYDNVDIAYSVNNIPLYKSGENKIYKLFNGKMNFSHIDKRQYKFLPGFNIQLSKFIIANKDQKIIAQGILEITNPKTPILNLRDIINALKSEVTINGSEKLFHDVILYYQAVKLNPLLRHLKKDEANKMIDGLSNQIYSNLKQLSKDRLITLNDTQFSTKITIEHANMYMNKVDLSHYQWKFTTRQPIPQSDNKVSNKVSSPSKLETVISANHFKLIKFIGLALLVILFLVLLIYKKSHQKK